MRVAVFGVGAVGGYFGGTLARAGHEVTFIARSYAQTGGARWIYPRRSFG
ncbi:MAG: hypothetical protein IH849_11085 [Acidobacteria bacterium]|nr:hypothetical protein [Acidobacteriota bacterium]